MSKNFEWKGCVQRLHPSYFALVMATGIVATASHNQHYESVSKVLFGIANAAFVVLLFLFFCRLFFYFSAMSADFSDPAKAPGFLTIVAAACVLGAGYAQSQNALQAALGFLYFGIALWMVLVYALLAATVLKSTKTVPEKGISGVWLLLVVAVQSISVLGAALAPHFIVQQYILFFLSLAAFGLGLVLYLMLMPLVFYRLAFLPLAPGEVKPSYWIDTGAAAITTVAACMLGGEIRNNVAFADFYPVVKSGALVFWVVGTFWIPLILMMQFWRYAVRKLPWNYEPGLWSMVFPLGMYAVASGKLADLLALSFLEKLSNGFAILSLVAWLAVFTGMSMHLIKLIKTPSGGVQPTPFHPR